MNEKNEFKIRRNYLELRKRLKVITPQESDELRNLPDILWGSNADGSIAGIVVLPPKLIGDTYDEQVKDYFARAHAAAEKNGPQSDPEGPAPVDQHATIAAERMPVDEMPAAEFELDGRGRRVPPKKMPWIRDAFTSDFEPSQ